MNKMCLFLLICVATATHDGLRGAPVEIPNIVVDQLFSEVISGLHEDIDNSGKPGWELVGASELNEWFRAEGAEIQKRKMNNLIRMERNKYHFPVPALTKKPVLVVGDTDLSYFFKELPKGIVRNGSLIAVKFYFFPSSVLDSEHMPIPFFLVRPAPEDLAEVDLEPGPSEEAEVSMLLNHLQAYEAFYAGRTRLHCGEARSARVCFRIAAEAGLAEAQHNLAKMFHDGMGGSKDLEAARSQFRLAADQGLTLSRCEYAEMCRRGIGGPKDLAEARAYFLLAAEQGCREAQVQLVLLLRQDLGGPQDLALARTWLQVMVDEGATPAQLAAAQTNGRGGASFCVIQ